MQRLNVSDGSGSDGEDFNENPLLYGVMDLNSGDELNATGELYADVPNIKGWSKFQGKITIHKQNKCTNSPARSSPLLYEVELTASDEDDDGSVLELVIPMQSSRYQRVPTSSPKKAKPMVKKYFYHMMCCIRK